jgi:hypothetical protein
MAAFILGHQRLETFFENRRKRFGKIVLMKSRLFRRAWPAGGALALFLSSISYCQIASSQTAMGPITQTFASAGSAPIRACNLKGENSATFQVTGAGPIDATSGTTAILGRPPRLAP